MSRNLKKGIFSELSTNVKPKDSALLEACMAGNLAAVKRFVTAGKADLNCRDSFGITPVQAAAWYRHKEVVEFLVSKGADVSLVDGAGNTILHYACWGGDREMVRFVLSQNFANINAKNKSGETATDRARSWGNDDVVDIMVSCRAQ
ncbi:ankyrin repeat domain-containing protein 29-like [Haliotis rufescens]|uniref:ankyrin repeat domain-containing protein 29-like n=1 Tax=Haliotis rufescens TaxID=6454 RepID=UPI001EB083B4|nr:ankyrin repeat domain-containing protein 29-like [Haliotis rufescens]